MVGGWDGLSVPEVIRVIEIGEGSGERRAGEIGLGHVSCGSIGDALGEE